jgi:hypothetical protein
VYSIVLVAVGAALLVVYRRRQSSDYRD